MNLAPPLSLLTLAQQDSTQSLPFAADILAAVGLGTGLVFWLMGRRLLKPAFALLGTLIGAIIGFFVAPTVTDSAFGVPSPYLGLGIGGVVGLGAGVLLFRFAVAITTGAALALAGGLFSAAYMHFAPQPSGPITQADAPAFQTPALDAASKLHGVVETVKPMATQVKGFLEQRYDDVHAAWSELPEHDQVVLGTSTLGAAVAGFVLGLFAPRRSAAIATALFGSALWLGCGIWLLHELHAPGHGYLNQGAIVWLPAWLVVAVVGVAVQVTGMRKKPEKAPE